MTQIFRKRSSSSAVTRKLIIRLRESMERGSSDSKSIVIGKGRKLKSCTIRLADPERINFGIVGSDDGAGGN